MNASLEEEREYIRQDAEGIDSMAIHREQSLITMRWKGSELFRKCVWALDDKMCSPLAGERLKAGAEKKARDEYLSAVNRNADVFKDAYRYVQGMETINNIVSREIRLFHREIRRVSPGSLPGGAKVPVRVRVAARNDYRRIGMQEFTGVKWQGWDSLPPGEDVLVLLDSHEHLFMGSDGMVQIPLGASPSDYESISCTHWSELPDDYQDQFDALLNKHDMES